MAIGIPDFNERLTTALTGAPDTPLVFLGNFEVEEQWARGEHTLPRFSAASASAVVNHMDELALLLAGPDDHVVLKTRPEEAYLDYLGTLGVGLPRIHAAESGKPSRTVTEDALEDATLLRSLRELASSGAQLALHGISEVEERLSRATGLPLGGPPAEICKAVNSKVYSRRVADELGIRQPRGWACETLEELSGAFAEAGVGGTRPVVVKEAFGVSGKGIAVLESERRRDRLYRMIAKRVESSEQRRVAFVVEEWVEKSGDLNYQFTVGRDGSVHFDFVKEQLTEGGVHKGHRIPADLSRTQLQVLTETAGMLGKRLSMDGFFGVVGVDAMIDPSGGIYPVVEINARNNMSTYQVPLQERFVGPGQLALARHYPLRLASPMPFREVRALLGDVLLRHVGGQGLLVNNFATVNAGLLAGSEEADGRLYGIVVADTAEELNAIDADIVARLAARREDRP